MPPTTDLPEGTKARIERLVGVHDFWEGRRRAGLKGEITPEMRRIIPFPPVEHPLVRTMPGGRKALYVGGHCIGVVGMADEEGRALVEQLYAHATQDKYVVPPPLAPARSGDLGQPLHDARRDPAAVERVPPRHAPDHDQRKRAGDLGLRMDGIKRGSLILNLPRAKQK